MYLNISTTNHDDLTEYSLPGFYLLELADENKTKGASGKAYADEVKDLRSI